ncbi:MAG: hypothetical protein GY870_08485 [archaeon]|nr:hypothetical protein [archaeon]
MQNNKMKEEINNEKSESESNPELSTDLIENIIEEMSNNLEEFIYAVSHDLKSPLVPIVGFSGLLKRKYSDILPDKAKSYISRIESNAVKLEQYLEGLLRLSRIGRKKKSENSNSNEIIEEVQIHKKDEILLDEIINRSSSEFIGAAKYLGIKIDIESGYKLLINEELIEPIGALFKEIIVNSIKFQYHPIEIEKNSSTKDFSQDGIEKKIKIFNIPFTDKKYKEIIKSALKTSDSSKNPNLYKFHIDPLLISKISSISFEENVEPEHENIPKIICVLDNGIGISDKISRTAFRIFQIPDTPDALYSKILNSENKYLQELISLMPPSVGMGFPIIQKICRNFNISAIIESTTVLKDEINHGICFYLIF